MFWQIVLFCFLLVQCQTEATNKFCQDVDDIECVKETINFMVTNLTANDPKMLDSNHYCTDYWGRKSPSTSSCCHYTQFVKMSLKNNTYTTVQAHNTIPNLDTFWSTLPDGFNEDLIRTLKSNTGKCCKFVGRDTMMAGTYWNLTSTDPMNLELDFALFFCCSPLGCFVGPTVLADAFTFPQYFNIPKREWNTNMNWVTFTNLASPMKLDKIAFYSEYRNGDDHFWFFENKCDSLTESVNCSMALNATFLNGTTAGNPPGRFFCCSASTSGSNAQGLNNYSATAKAILQTQAFMAEFTELDKCWGFINQSSKMCFLNVDLYAQKTYYDQDYTISMPVYKRSGATCFARWTKENYVLPTSFCECSYDNGNNNCDKPFYENLDFISSVLANMTGQYCEDDVKKRGSAVVACKISMWLENGQVRISHSSVELGHDNTEELDLLAGKPNNYCDRKGLSVDCYCRANYTGTDFCNKRENFQEEYDRLHKEAQRPVTELNLYKTEMKTCGVNSKNREQYVKYLQDTVDFHSHLMCYANFTGIDVNNGIPDEKKLFVYNQVNEDVDMLSRIVCERAWEEDYYYTTVEGCNCLRIQSQDGTFSPICCCFPSRLDSRP